MKVMRAYRRAGCLIFLLIDILDCNARIIPSAAGNAKLFEGGTSQSYQVTTSVILNEPGGRKGKEVGYQVQGDVGVGVVWQSSEDRNDKLLEVELRDQKLLIMSRKAPTPEGFDVHKSRLDNYVNHPFLIHWRNGKIIDLYMDEREETSLLDFEKGIASLFQFQLLDMDTEETDASGRCNVTYKSINPFSFSKTKTGCVPPPELKVDNISDPVLGPRITSSRTATYKLSQDLTTLDSVSATEHHLLRMVLRKEAGSSVSSTQFLTIKKKSGKAKMLQSASLDAAIEEFEELRKVKMAKHNLGLRAFAPKCDKEDCPSLPKLIKENRQHLTSSSLGTLRSASAFVRLLSAARSASKEDLAKAFKGSKNKEILAQLCDLAGAIQLPESHQVMMKILNLDAEDDFDNSERYLWALATGFRPHESVVRDIFKISQRPHPTEKLSDTLLLTLASMANNLRRNPVYRNSPLLHEISDSILGDLQLCKDDACRLRYLRPLGNLNCPRTIPALVHHALTGTKKPAVEAIKALRSFAPAHWADPVIDAAQKIYFQVGRRYDSSSRTLALDILLESNPRPEVLEELLLDLTRHDPAYEVKRYLAQRVRQLSEKDAGFAERVRATKGKFPREFGNYNAGALRGMTTAFGREFARDELRNGSLETVLEISKGLLKRGIVDVVVESGGKSLNLFRLGLFAAGLTSFVSSDDKDEAPEAPGAPEEEPATAGMELSVLGSHLRPFVFFSGQGELMGHVWSGTASERTVAYQALLLAVDHREYIPLQSGFVAQVEVLGGVSFDLSGQIQISLWNRNAHSLVEKNAGISLQGRVRVDTSFVRSKVEFNTGTEVKLDLQSDLNFYGGTALCMQLSQPEVVIKQSLHKIESIPGGKHRLRKSKYTREVIPGRTYALNKKNDEICSSIFSG